MEHEVLIFKVFGESVHKKLGHFNSWISTFDFTWNCCRLLETKNFSRNPGRVEWATRKTGYQLPIVKLPIWNLKCQVAKLVRRTKTMLKLLYVSENNQFFQHSSGIKICYDRFRKLYLWMGRHNLGPVRQFQQNYTPGKPPGHISPGSLDTVYKLDTFWMKMFEIFERAIFSIFENFIRSLVTKRKLWKTSFE